MILGDKPASKVFLLCCVIVFLLNAIAALTWRLWDEISFSKQQQQTIIELQNELKK